MQEIPHALHSTIRKVGHGCGGRAQVVSKRLSACAQRGDNLEAFGVGEPAVLQKASPHFIPNEPRVSSSQQN